MYYVYCTCIGPLWTLCQQLIVKRYTLVTSALYTIKTSHRPTQTLKNYYSVSISVSSALEVYLYTTMRYINRRFTYLLTYLHNVAY